MPTTSSSSAAVEVGRFETQLADVFVSSEFDRFLGQQLHLSIKRLSTDWEGVNTV